ncbi:ATP-binding protein [Paucibacter sp. Y2R2-4]|uniref:tetratricopeptide repeat-containing sensor histidine kinase n=1 Tax=Paucibacter sp. Y2R2-4 TaxID=2893553 RepID=UPI0021E3D296|nr:ATP-binding protein [Paucibacter sp. Y2R2-4]MCV2350572.1 tetratricopeptide repeat protein [Paucibacter sp. Y2R2-4]
MKQDSPALYELNAEVEALAKEATSLAGPEGLIAQVHWAWHLRERDSSRALLVAEHAERELEQISAQQLSAEHRQSLRWRLQLSAIDVRRLRNESAQDGALAEQIYQAAREAGDCGNAIDACWVLAQVATSLGDTQKCSDWLTIGAQQAHSCGDSERQSLLECSQARYAGVIDRYAAEAQWGDHFESKRTHSPPRVAPMLDLYGAYRAMRASRLSEAIQRFSAVIDPLIELGCIREAIAAQANLGSVFNDLNDPEAALEWMEKALTLARKQAWSFSIGTCQMQLGETLRKLGRLDLAQEQLNESLQCFARWPATRNHCVSLNYLGWLALDQNQPQRAADYFDKIQAAGGFADLQLSALRGQGHALLQLGDLDAAEKSAQEALLLAQQRGAADLVVQLGLLLAHIAQRRPVPAADLALQYLEQAREQAAAITGYKGSSELLHALAQAYADSGRYAQAYEASQEAAQSRAQSLSAEAANRLASIQLRNLNDSARAQTEHLHALAEAERQKALLMQRNSDTLELLGRIGQELTRQLDLTSIFSALVRHIPSLLDARAFEVYLLDETGSALDSIFGLEDGQALPHDRIELSDPDSNAARCALERTELSIQLAHDGSDPSQVPGTMRTLSALFAPLLIGERLLGVVTVQSPLAHAYGEHERMIFRTLNAYLAIALDNANAYKRLQQAQAQLIAQEKLAALGALVAGIAHELNTPLGNSLLMASTLEQRTSEVEQAAAAKSLRRSELEGYLTEAKSMARLIMQGLETAARLITSFKQVAVDQTAEQRRGFELAGMCEQLLATLRAAIRKHGHHIELDVPAGIVMNSFPGPLGQVISNLVNNAMLHGFGERKDGHMRLSARLLNEGRVELRFQDDGVGISASHASRIFEPFFTTKFGQGGSGLGLSISHNIVNSLLGGSLNLDPRPGPGCCFVMLLPLQAPPAKSAAPEQESGGQTRAEP